jgi:hypothetical protein
MLDSWKRIGKERFFRIRLGLEGFNLVEKKARGMLKGRIMDKCGIRTVFSGKKKDDE